MNIGQAAEDSGVNAKMIRYYERISLISSAQRTDSGYRQYGEKDIQTLRFIRRSRELGFSIERIRTLLGLWEDRGRKSADVKNLAQQYIAELDDHIAKLQSIRSELLRMSESCHGDQRPECPIIDGLAPPCHGVASDNNDRVA